MTRPVILALCAPVLAAAALALRLPQLAQRPMHTDEAVQAVKAGALFDTGQYRYDPDEYHGPTLPYATRVALSLRGVDSFPASDEADYRLVPALAGSLIVLLPLVAADALGAPAVLLAAVLTAASPAMVFYSRYYIHETFLLLFTFVALICAWRYARGPGTGWALATGLAVGLMHATKETWVLNAAAAVAALVGVWAWERRRPGLLAPPVAGTAPPPCRRRHAVVALVAAVAVAGLLFSSLFSNASGPLDSLLTFTTYWRRGSGAGSGPHDHPWYYYLQLLAWSRSGRGPLWTEALILGLAAVGGAATAAGRLPPGVAPRAARFLAVYTLALTALYAAIPYKTPWCLLTFLHGFVLLAGVGGAVVLGAVRRRWWQAAIVCLLGLGTCHLAGQAWRGATRFGCDRRNPYVYAHTGADVLNLAARLDALTRVHPEGNRLLVQVFADDCWPLPWYLRRLERVGYWQTTEAVTDAPVLIASPALQADLERRLPGRYQTEYYGLRPGALVAVYIREDVWDAFLRTRTASPATAGGS